MYTGITSAKGQPSVRTFSHGGVHVKMKGKTAGSDHGRGQKIDSMACRERVSKRSLHAGKWVADGPPSSIYWSALHTIRYSYEIRVTSTRILRHEMSNRASRSSAHGVVRKNDFPMRSNSKLIPCFVTHAYLRLPAILKYGTHAHVTQVGYYAQFVCFHRKTR